MLCVCARLYARVYVQARARESGAKCAKFIKQFKGALARSAHMRRVCALAYKSRYKSCVHTERKYANAINRRVLYMAHCITSTRLSSRGWKSGSTCTHTHAHASHSYTHSTTTPPAAPTFGPYSYRRPFNVVQSCV